MRAAGRPEAGAAHGVGQEPLDGGGQRDGVLRGHETPGDSVADQLGVAADAGRDHRLFHRHRLEDRVGHPFEARAVHVDVGGREHLGNVAADSREARGPAPRAIRRGTRARPGGLVARGPDEEPGRGTRGPDLGEGAEQRRIVLHAADAAHADHDVVLGGDPQLASYVPSIRPRVEPGQIHAVAIARIAPASRRQTVRSSRARSRRP